ncbi:MAG: hypothetical protein ABI401_04350 [Candidatus Dormibacter sp.]
MNRRLVFAALPLLLAACQSAGPTPLSAPSPSPSISAKSSAADLLWLQGDPPAGSHPLIDWSGWGAGSGA